MRLLVIAAVAAITAAPALTEGQVRAFVARQERAWNAGDLAAYFASFAPDAVFVDQARANDNSVVPYGKSTVAEARRQARRAFATGRVSETGQVTGIRIAGAVARVASYEVIRAGGRTACAERLQTLVLAAGRLRSNGQTDTVVRCRRAR